MISIEATRSGHSVLRKNGRLLGSSIDPMREAVQWTEKVSAKNQVVVLGLGTGYHVVELMKRPGAKVLTIEADPEVVEKALCLNPTLSRHDIVVEPNWQYLVHSARFRDALQGIFEIAPHGPSVQIEPDYFSNVERLLLGRDKISFLLQLKLRPELLALLDADAIALLAEQESGELLSAKNEAISVKTVKKLFSNRADHSVERRLWRVLEELVL